GVVGLVGRLRESAVIYHCVDDYAEFRGMNGPALRRAERELLKVADLVLTSSELLWRERRQENPRTFLIQHGVDVDHFARALDPGLPIPADVEELPRPIIGYVGLIADYVDLELMAQAVRRSHRCGSVCGRNRACPGGAQRTREGAAASGDARGELGAPRRRDRPARS